MDSQSPQLSGLDPTQVDEQGCIWVSGLVDDWAGVRERGITVVIDLEGDVDHGIPTAYDEILYIYLPIHDATIPNRARLHSVARLVATLAAGGQRVLCHCGAGLNRSPLVAGLALVIQGLQPQEAVDRIRSRRPGALYNEHFVNFLLANEPTQ